ncbi:hypothetical protein D3C87_1441860 [compost metagenome]
MSIHQLDESDGRGPRGDGAIAEVDIALAQRLAQDVTHHVIGKTGEEGRRDTQTAKCDGRIEDGATGIGRKGRFAKRRLTRQHVDQSFAAAQDHRFPPEIIVSPIDT